MEEELVDKKIIGLEPWTPKSKTPKFMFHSS